MEKLGPPDYNQGKADLTRLGPPDLLQGKADVLGPPDLKLDFSRMRDPNPTVSRRLVLHRLGSESCWVQTLHLQLLGHNLGKTDLSLNRLGASRIQTPEAGGFHWVQTLSRHQRCTGPTTAESIRDPNPYFALLHSARRQILGPNPYRQTSGG